MARTARPQPNAGAVGQPKPAALRLPPRRLQPLTPSDPRHPLGIHLPALAPPQRRDPTVAVTPRRGRQPHHRLAQCCFIDPDPRLSPLGGTRLAQGAAGSSVGQPERRANMPHPSPAARGAQTFSSASDAVRLTLQDQLVQRQIRHRALQPGIVSFHLLRTACLIYLQAAILRPPETTARLRSPARGRSRPPAGAAPT